jgi:nitroreductase
VKNIIARDTQNPQIARMFNDLSTPLTYLSTRRTAKAKDMIAPGPDADQMQHILSIAARTPDHGKLAPWRFLTITADQRTDFAAMLHAAYRVSKPDPGRLEIEAIDKFAYQAPMLVVAIFSPKTESHIPQWEQQLSVGAATMNLMHGAHAMGFGACWLTGWATYDAQVAAGLGLAAHEAIAGFIFIGTSGAAMEERPRPDVATVASPWHAGA